MTWSPSENERFIIGLKKSQPCHIFSILFLFLRSHSFSSLFDCTQISSRVPFFSCTEREEHTWTKHTHNMRFASHHFRVTHSKTTKITINCGFLSRLHFINAVAARSGQFGSTNVSLRLLDTFTCNENETKRSMKSKTNKKIWNEKKNERFN